MALQYNTANTVTFRKVTLLNNPYVNEHTGLPWVQGQDNRGFQYQITLDALPPGININLVSQGQIWFIENSTTAWRLNLYAGTNGNPITIVSGVNNTAKGYYANIYDTTTQSGVVNIPQAIQFNSVTDNYNFSVISGSYITAHSPGTYNIQFSAQFNKSNASSGLIGIWLSQNNVDVVNSATSYTIAGQSLAVPAWNWITTMASGDNVQLMWATDDANTRIYAQSAQASPWIMPSVPSIILTVTQV